MKTQLLIDFPYLSIRTLYAKTGIDHVKDGFAFHKHLVLSSILYNIRKFSADEVVLAVDDLKQWRKKIYFDYKAHRKLEREASTFDWAAYFKYIDEFLQELKLLPFILFKFPYF